MQVLHRAHPGAPLVTAVAGRRRPRSSTRRSGWSRSTSWASCATSTEDPATGRVTVTITPTYSGCPAMDVIRADIRARAAPPPATRTSRCVTVLRPAWTTDWITEAGRAKLAAAGIAPPARRRRRRRCR